MNAEAQVYLGDENAVVGDVMVERPGYDVGVHFQIDGKVVASAFLNPFQLGVLVGQLSQAGIAEGAPA